MTQSFLQSLLSGGARKSRKASQKHRAATYKRWVWEGKLSKTPGGLKKSDLMVRPADGQIISRKKHALGKSQLRKLKAAGLAAAPFRRASRRSSKRKSR